MRLAKQQIDVGLFTNRRDEQLAFWSERAGLTYDHLGKLGGGIQQHRHHMNGSILKLNHARDPLPVAPPSTIRRVTIPRDDSARRQDLVDPDGNAVRLTPKADGAAGGITVELRVSDIEASDEFYVDVMGFDRVNDGTWRCGESLIVANEVGPVAQSDDWRALGFRYLTVQVWDCVAEHEGILRRGGREGRAPVVLGDTVRYSFVRDPDGLFIEISQRASLTGGTL